MALINIIPLFLVEKYYYLTNLIIFHSAYKQSNFIFQFQEENPIQSQNSNQFHFYLIIHLKIVIIYKQLHKDAL